MQWIIEGIIVTAVAVIYLAPAFIAERRGHCNAVAIYILTLFLGWTFIGWAVALVWACTANITPILDDTEIEPSNGPEDDLFKLMPPAQKAFFFDTPMTIAPPTQRRKTFKTDPGL